MDLKANWDKGYTLEAYFEEHKQQVAENRAAGENQSEDYIRYTKLNYARLKRSLKNVVLTPKVTTAVEKIQQPLYLLVLTETWCGDSAQNLAPLFKVQEANPLVKIKVLERDNNLELMDAYLTNGGRAIPKVIAFNEGGKELFTWGPRPEKAQDLVMAWKNEAEPKDTYEEFSIKLQNWYNTNKGEETLNELAEVLSF